jgi:hypothetical protein
MNSSTNMRGVDAVPGEQDHAGFKAGDGVADYDALLTRIQIIDDVLDDHSSVLGKDLVAYRNHVYRVVNLCVAIVGDRGALEKIATAAVFHDLEIWTDRTVDYLAPSIALVREHLVAHARDGSLKSQ